MSEQKDRTLFRGSELRRMILLLVLGVAAGIACAIIWRRHGELSRIFVTGTVALIGGSLLGGIVSLLIADFDRRRVQRAAQIEFISNILTELKSVYDRVDRGRTLMAAHQSAKTYRDQMDQFIDVRVKLLAVDRALRFDERRRAIGFVLHHVRQMEMYLSLLIDEFIRNYKNVSGLQSIYEAQKTEGLKQPATPKLPVNTPWIRIASFHEMKDFLTPLTDSLGIPKNESKYARMFLGSLDLASDQLRRALEMERR